MAAYLGVAMPACERLRWRRHERSDRDPLLEACRCGLGLCAALAATALGIGLLLPTVVIKQRIVLNELLMQRRSRRGLVRIATAGSKGL